MRQQKTLISKLYENKIALNNDALLTAGKNINDHHGIDIGRALDFMTHRIPLDEASIFELFCLAEEIGGNDIELGDYFTEMEIKAYTSYATKEEPPIELPIKIKCIKIAENQYIGKTDVQFFMRLRGAQLLRYNKNAQRNMETTVRGDKKFFKITVNDFSVEKIKDSFLKGNYIPNTITLNIPVSPKSEFFYDEKNYELVINNIEAFDITDGYQRYIAMCGICDDRDFNYPMELRIISFDDSKTNTFKFQEEQTSKMSKVYSDSLNMNAPENIIVEKVNTDPRFYFKGSIMRYEYKIDFAEMSLYVREFMTNGSIDLQSIVQLNIVNDIIDGFNGLVDLHHAYLDHIYNETELAIIMYGISKGKSPNEIHKALISIADVIDPVIYRRYKTLYKAAKESIVKLYGEEE